MDVAVSLYDSVRETNNVAHGSFNRPIDTRRIVLENPSATFNKNKLGGCGFSLVYPNHAALSIHKSGRFSVMGTKSRTQTALAISKLKYIMASYVPALRLAASGYTINNVVCCGHVAPINLARMQALWPHAVRYDPVIFNSAATISCRDIGIPNTNVYVYAFQSGKCNIIGAKSREEADRSFEEIKKLVLDKVRISDSVVTDASPPVRLSSNTLPNNNNNNNNLAPAEVEEAEEEEDEDMTTMIMHMQTIVESTK